MPSARPNDSQRQQLYLLFGFRRPACLHRFRQLRSLRALRACRIDHYQSPRDWRRRPVRRSARDDLLADDRERGSGQRRDRLMAGVRFSGTGIYLATPLASSADLAPSLSFRHASVGANATLSAVTNNGPAAAQTITLVVTLPPHLDFQEAVGGVTMRRRAPSLSPSHRSHPARPRCSRFVVNANVAGHSQPAPMQGPPPDSDRTNNHVSATTNAISAFAATTSSGKSSYNHTPVPDRTGETFLIPAGLDPVPALDGNKVVFIAFDPNNVPVIWSANADGSGDFRRLVDEPPLVPGGAGRPSATRRTFVCATVTSSSWAWAPIRCTTAFTPSRPRAARWNPSSLPVRPRPEGTGNFGYQDFLQSFSYGYMGDGRICFVAQNGLYAYPVGGRCGRVVVYPGSNIPTAGNAGVCSPFRPRSAARGWSGKRPGAAMPCSGVISMIGTFPRSPILRPNRPARPDQILSSRPSSAFSARKWRARRWCSALLAERAPASRDLQRHRQRPGREVGRYQYRSPGRQWKFLRFPRCRQPGHLRAQRRRSCFPRGRCGQSGGPLFGARKWRGDHQDHRGRRHVWKFAAAR